MAKSRFKINLGRIPLYLWVSAWAISELFVFFWMVYSSFKSNPEFLRNIWALPSSLNFVNYINDLQGNTSPPIPIGQYLGNSAIVTFGSVVGILLVSIPAGYVLSKKSRYSDLLFYFSSCDFDTSSLHRERLGAGQYLHWNNSAIHIVQCAFLDSAFKSFLQDL